MFNALVLAVAVATSSTPQVAFADTDRTASCPVRNSPATVALAASPDTPVIAKLMHLTGMTSVLVDIDANGSVVDAAVAKSSGTPLLDTEALAATHRSEFRPEIRNCTALPGSYVYEVVFTDD